MAQKPFKRINFFKGFLTTEQDWNQAEQYHVDKRKLHNRAFHAPGVCRGLGDELRVTSRGRGDLSVEIGSGYAIDAQGNDVYVPEKQIRTLNPSDFKLPQTIYLVLRYVEEFADFIAYKENLDYQGHRRVEESYKLDFTIVEPDINHEVELARIYLEKDARRLTDARDPFAPGANELDLRFVRLAGVAGTRLSPLILWRLQETTSTLKRLLAYLGRVKKIIAAQDAFHAVITFEMLLSCDQVDTRNIWNLLQTLAELEWDVVAEVEGRVPDLSARKEFTGFKKNMDIVRGLVGERRRSEEGLDNVITYQGKACEAMELLIEHVRPEVIDVQAMVGAPQTSTLLEGGIAYEDIKVRSEPFTETIIVDGREWRLVDMIDVLDADSEAAHEFTISNAKDTYRTRQKLRYPDGVSIEDAGIAHEGGFCEFRVGNLTPHQDLVIIRRMDYVHGDYQAEIHCNDQRLERILDCRGGDRKYRWRNWPYVVPAQHISTDSVKIKQVMLTADRDINMFHYWFYQPA